MKRLLRVDPNKPLLKPWVIDTIRWGSAIIALSYIAGKL